MIFKNKLGEFSFSLLRLIMFKGPIWLVVCFGLRRWMKLRTIHAVSLSLAIPMIGNGMVVADDKIDLMY